MKYCFLMLFVFTTVFNGFAQNFSEVQKNPLKTLTLDVQPNSIISSGIPGQVIICSEAGIELIDINTGKTLKTLLFKKDDFNLSADSSVFTLCRAWVSSDAKYMLVSTLKKFRLYSMDNWTKPLMDITQQAHLAAFSPANNKFYIYESKYFFTGKDYEDTSTVNGYIYTWDIASKKMLKKTSVGLDGSDYYNGNLHIKTSNGEDHLYFVATDFIDSEPHRKLVSVNLVSGKSTKISAGLELGEGQNDLPAYHECMDKSVIFSALMTDYQETAVCQAMDINTGKKVGYIELKQYPGKHLFINCQTSPDGKYLFLKYHPNDNPEGQKGFVAVYTIEKSGANLLLSPYKLFPGSDSDSDYSCLMPDNQTLVIVSKWDGKELTVWKL